METSAGLVSQSHWRHSAVIYIGAEMERCEEQRIPEVARPTMGGRGRDVSVHCGGHLQPHCTASAFHWICPG